MSCISIDSTHYLLNPGEFREAIRQVPSVKLIRQRVPWDLGFRQGLETVCTHIYGGSGQGCVPYACMVQQQSIERDTHVEKLCGGRLNHTFLDDKWISQLE